ncbi:MATE family efflux transporter [Pseudoalteromonas phenolica]|uniref:MATE family efflux transporter n=1 Tax=Pseudoalteromonas phenolica TaxID=161398 RepID=UPI00110A69B0|nr:MATE family efflux transporter [Pseudoalteromonas phenolica]TMO54545.1 hypothetical protein CWC21_14245 [Pseudoalteromonas phenolica]
MQKSQTLCYLSASPWQLLRKTTAILLPAICILLAYDLAESSMIANTNEQLLQLYGYAQPLFVILMAFAVALSVRTNMAMVQLVDQKNKGLFAHIRFGVFASAAVSIFLLLTLDEILALFGFSEWLSTLSDVQSAEFSSEIMSFLTMRISTLFALVVIWQVSSALRALNDCWCSALYLLLWMVCKSVGLTVLVQQDEPNLLSSLGELHALIDALFAAIGLSLVFMRHKSSLFASDKAVNGNLDTILIICQQLIPACSLALLTYIASQFDTAFIAVFALTFKIEALALLIPMVLTASLPAIVGVNYWSNNKKRAAGILKSALFLIIVMQCVIAVLLYLFQSQLFAGICPDCQQIVLLKYFIQFMPISYVGLGMSMVYVSCLNAMGKSKQAMVFLAFHRLLLIPILAVLGLNLLGNMGLFIGLAVSHFIMGGFVFYQIAVVYSRSSDEQYDMVQLGLQTEKT